MLILHLDLIQQQADKLALKEMELATRNDETNALRMCIERLETQVSELQKQVQKQLKCAVMERTSVPPPPLAKIQCLHENIKSATTTTKTAALDKMPIKPETPKPDEKTAICAEVKQNAKTNNNSTLNERVLNVVNSNNNNQDIKTVKIQNNHLIKSNENEEIPSCEESTIVESTNKEKMKNTRIENQNINIENQNNSLVKSEDSAIKNDENETQEIKNNNNNNNQSKSISSVPSSPCSSPAQHGTTNPGNNHKKKRRLWHMTHDDEQSIESSEFTSDMETISSSTHSVTPSNLFDKLDSMICGGSSENSHDSKCSSFNSELSIKSSELDTRPTSDALVYCNAKEPYLSRTWLEEELDGELEEEEARALRALEPKLEIPKWTEHEIIPCYSVDGTEDLSDEIFLKRHGKQELDEKRRKKWDVQQIREQRRIDKLRKRHYKDELIQGPVITSFFPLPEDLETICYMDSLPLQAFGESIPKLPGGFNGFALPWLIEADVTRTMRPPRHLLSDFLKLHHKRTTKEALTSSKDDIDKNDKPNVSPEEVKLENVEETVNSAELVKMDRDIVMSEENVEQGTEAKSSLRNEEEQKMAVESSNENLASTTTTTNITITDKESKVEGVKTASEATSEEILANVNKSCFATPTVMLAQNARSCASRTQMRKRLKYSSYLFISKRKRFQSMSAFAETNSNKLTMNAAITAKNSTTNLKNINSNNLSGSPEVNNEVVEEKVKVPREAMIIAEAKEEEPTMEETSVNMESTMETVTTVTATTNHDDENDEKVRDESKTTKEIMCN